MSDKPLLERMNLLTTDECDFFNKSDVLECIRSLYGFIEILKVESKDFECCLEILNRIEEFNNSFFGVLPEDKKEAELK